MAGEKVFDVLLVRMVKQEFRVGILAETAKEAERTALKLDKVHRDGGWQSIETSNPEVGKVAKRPGLADPKTGRWVDPQ